MLTLTTPVQVQYTDLRATSLRVTLTATLEVLAQVRDAAGNDDTHVQVFDADNRQGIKVLPSGRLGTYTEPATPGYAASLFNTFATAAGGVTGKFRALEAKLRDDGLWPAGAVA